MATVAHDVSWPEVSKITWPVLDVVVGAGLLYTCEEAGIVNERAVVRGWLWASRGKVGMGSTWASSNTTYGLSYSGFLLEVEGERLREFGDETGGEAVLSCFLFK